MGLVTEQLSTEQPDHDCKGQSLSPNTIKESSASLHTLNPDKSFTKNFSTRTTVHVSLVWKDINLSILTKDTKRSTLLHTEYKSKKILQNISGSASSGELLAIMGPTGCLNSILI
jgi:hypothetical protein